MMKIRLPVPSVLRITVQERMIRLSVNCLQAMVSQTLFFLPLPFSKKPALVVELKYDKSANTAMQQIRDRQYIQALEGYSGEILLVGVNYDRDSDNKPHSCVIERLVYEQ